MHTSNVQQTDQMRTATTTRQEQLQQASQQQPSRHAWNQVQHCLLSGRG